MDFRILGPIEALDGGRKVTLGGSKLQALLAVLLVHANETLSTDQLIDELWGPSPPATAAKTVQVHISRLRKALGGPAGNGSPGAIVTREHGYRLELDPDRLDAARFERLVEDGRIEFADGRPARAAASFERALALWRGPPLSDVAYEPFAQREIARLEELRVAALERLIEAKLALGRHAEVVGELEALIREHPYREGLHAQLMLALYRSERQADALQAYQSARRRLVEALGIEPGERLRDLEQAILAQDPALQVTVADEAAAPEPASATRRGVFVGRDAELRELVTGLDDALAGRGRLFLLAGEPGIGKSRLADELMRQARAGGARLLVGRCWEAGGAPAYWPWVQALRVYVRDTEPERLRAHLGSAASDLALLLPEVRDLFPDVPTLPARESEGARFRLFDAVSGFLRSAASARPVVLVLDDMHAADEPSLLLLRFVARELAGSRLLLVCAYRDVDPALQDPLTAALSELVREPHTAQLVLGGLSAPDVAEYIEHSTGTAPATRVVEAISTETEGNPLFVTEVVRLLEAQGAITDDEAQLRIPPGVHAAIAQRLRRLPEPCRNVLVPAAVVGREFELQGLARLCGLTGLDLLDILSEAIAERILGEVPGSPGRLRFGHALIRDTLYEDLSPAARCRLHQQVGEALEALYSPDLEPHLSELAQHFLAAGATAGEEKAIDYARRAGDRAVAQHAYEEAARLYEMALSLLTEGLPRCELLLRLGDAEARAGDLAGADRALREAADVADALGLKEHLAEAALGYGGRVVWVFSRGDPDHVPLLERALAAVGDADSALRARLLARYAAGPARDPRFPPEKRLALSEEALAVARRVGDPETLAYALSGYNASRHSPEFTLRQADLATELLEAAREAGDLERAAEGLEHRAMARLELADIASAKADLAAMAELAEELRQPAQQWFATVYRALVALLEGRLAEAEHAVEAARRLGERGVSFNAELTYAGQHYLLRREQGRLAEAEELVRGAVERFPAYPCWRGMRTQMAAELGYRDEARAGLAELAADDFAGLPFDDDWLVGMTFLSDSAAALGDRESAASIYRRLLPFADRIAVSISCISTGAVARCLGLLAATTAAWDDAQRHFERALELNARIGAPSWLAHSQRGYAWMLSARDAPGDAERAAELSVRAREGYRNLGMEAWVSETAEPPPPEWQRGSEIE